VRTPGPIEAKKTIELALWCCTGRWLGVNRNTRLRLGPGALFAPVFNQLTPLTLCTPAVETSGTPIRNIWRNSLTNDDVEEARRGEDESRKNQKKRRDLNQHLRRLYSIVRSIQ